MKLTQNNTSKKKLIIIVASVALLAGGVSAFSYFSSAEPENSSSENQSNDKKRSSNTDSEFDDSKDKDSGYNSANPARDNPTNQPPSAGTSDQPPSATISIPSYQARNGRITVNVAIDQPWGGDAVCKMEIEGPRSLTVTENVFPQAQLSGCPLEVTDMPSGSYNLTIYAEKGDQRTNIKNLNVSL